MSGGEWYIIVQSVLVPHLLDITFDFANHQGDIISCAGQVL